MDVTIIIAYSSFAIFVLVSFLVLKYIWKDFFYNHRLLFVMGLAFGRSLTKNAIISSIPWYFTDYGNIDLANSAILTNILGSLSLLFAIFMAHSYIIGRFQTLLCSNIAYIGTLLLLWIFHPDGVNWLLVVSLVILALGKSGDQTLQQVLEDLVNDVDHKPQDQDKTQYIEPAIIWSRMLYVSGAVAASFWVSPYAIGGVPSSWPISFLICTITMTLASVIFCFGRNVYHSRKPTERYVEVFFGVLQPRITNLLKSEARFQKKVDIEKGENERIPQKISTLHLDTKVEEHKMNITSANYKEDVLVVKILIRLFLITGVFLVVSMISATGSAFFLQQYSNLNTDNDIAVQMYNLVQDFSKFAIPFLYHWIRCVPKNEKVKIGLGVLCGVGSCICAWQLEIFRLKEVGDLVDGDTKTSISFLWLVPQFCALGCMEGLTEDGLLKFYESQQYLQRFRDESVVLVMAIGKVLNIILILICKQWFGDTINDSQLDRYYLVLVLIGSVNFVAYCCIAIFCYKDQQLANDVQDLGEDDQIEDNDAANHDLKKDYYIEQSPNIEQNQDLDEDDHKQDDQVSANDDYIEQSADIEQNQDLAAEDDHINKMIISSMLMMIENPWMEIS